MNAANLSALSLSLTIAVGGAALVAVAIGLFSDWWRPRHVDTDAVAALELALAGIDRDRPAGRSAVEPALRRELLLVAADAVFADLLTRDLDRSADLQALYRRTARALNELSTADPGGGPPTQPS